MKGDTKTILISAYHGWVFRNLVSSRGVQDLLGRADIRVVLVVPPDKEDLTRELCGNKALVEVFDADPLIATKYNKFWYRLGFLIENTQYVRDQRLDRYWRNRNFLGWLNYHLLDTLSLLLSHFSPTVHLYRVLDYWFSPRDAVAHFIDTYHPDVVMVGDLFGEPDILFLRNARARRIRTLGMVRSWDNTTTKGILRFVPERIIANSSTIRRELHDIHRVDTRLVDVVGLPQFDSWITGPTMDREAFHSRLGVDAHRRLLLFAPAGNVMSDTDWQLCQILKDAFVKHELPDDLTILIRNHPQHPADLSRFIPDKHFVIEAPGTCMNPHDYRGATLNRAENDHLRNSVYYSEIVMYIATSIGLDATVFDKPQIIVSFDGWETRPMFRSVLRFNREDCLANMVASGGTSVVFDADSWIGEITAYLSDSSRRAEGRARARRDHMNLVIGDSGREISQKILEMCGVPLPSGIARKS